MASRATSTGVPSTAWCVLGLATGVGATSSLWLVLLGLRVDAEGSSASSFELVAGWGGLLVAQLGWLVGAALLSRRAARPPRR